MKKLLISIAAIFFLFSAAGCTTESDGKDKIIYVPLDERPVNYAYAVESIQNITEVGGTTGASLSTKKSVEIIAPPEKFLPNIKEPGDTDQLWQWVFDNSAEAQYIVLSADTMIYGGLTPSRIHNIQGDKLTQLVSNFARVKEINPDVKLYVFDTVMRTHRASTNIAEPDYYGTYGSHIFKISALQDQAEVEGLSAEEELHLSKLLEEVPDVVLDDWMDRRNKNFVVNQQLIFLNQQGVIDFFILSRDDTASYSQSSREYRLLREFTAGLSEDKYASFPGADEVGLLLLTRAVNHSNNKTPAVFVHYAPGLAEKTVPAYEDQEIWQNIEAHIGAAGAKPTESVVEADLILMVNTPENGITKEAGATTNVVAQNDGIDYFVARINGYVERGSRVAVADIAFSNGSDNTLMSALADRGLLNELSAYGGWNTAGNAMGYALSQGLLSEHMDEEGVSHLLAVRLLDDWGYQANVRGEINGEVIASLDADRHRLGDAREVVTKEVEERLNEFAKDHLADFNIHEVKVSLPWNRIFDVSVEVKPSFNGR